MEIIRIWGIAKALHSFHEMSSLISNLSDSPLNDVKKSLNEMMEWHSSIPLHTPFTCFKEDIGDIWDFKLRIRVCIFLHAMADAKANGSTKRVRFTEGKCGRLQREAVAASLVDVAGKPGSSPARPSFLRWSVISLQIHFYKAQSVHGKSPTRNLRMKRLRTSQVSVNTNLPHKNASHFILVSRGAFLTFLAHATFRPVVFIVFLHHFMSM